MRPSLMALVLLAAACHSPSGDTPADAPRSGDAARALDAAPDAPADPLAAIYGEVDGSNVIQLVQQMSGAVPVTAGSDTFSITERFSDAGRAQFREFWTAYMTNLGLTVTPLHFDATAQDRELDDLEAVLPGPTPDSIIVIVHYDSIGPPGEETTNPGADDDMSGMAIELETARLFVEHASQLGYTVRFVAADAEELGDLAGARAYAAKIKADSQAAGFQLVAAVDDEQSGWACHDDNDCADAVWPAYDVYSCGTSNDGQRHYDFSALGDQLEQITTTYSPMKVVRGCMGENSDHFAMWEVGVPAVVYSEHDPLRNDHFDQSGGDLFSRIDTDYLVSIARPAITFQAALAGLHSGK
jgi:hypothetical protein|nr:M28 family peptidase [Kofleriaceae bacterium]